MSVISKLMTSAQTTLGDARGASAVVTGNTGFSFAWVMGWVQDNIGYIGYIGTVAGGILTIVTIWAQVVNIRKGNAELELLRRQLEE